MPTKTPGIMTPLPQHRTGLSLGTGTTANTLSVTSPNADVTLESGSRVTTLNVGGNANDTTIATESGSKITTANLDSDGAEITSKGSTTTSGGSSGGSSSASTYAVTFVTTAEPTGVTIVSTPKTVTIKYSTVGAEDAKTGTELNAGDKLAAGTYYFYLEAVVTGTESGNGTYTYAKTVTVKGSAVETTVEAGDWTKGVAGNTYSVMKDVASAKADGQIFFGDSKITVGGLTVTTYEDGAAGYEEISALWVTLV